MAALEGGGGAPRVGGRARQPWAGSTDVMPARTLAGRARPRSPARQGHPMYSTCSRSRAAREPQAAQAVDT
eukprot:15448439-Alexandrium_andersonii.AAC.1